VVVRVVMVLGLPILLDEGSLDGGDERVLGTQHVLL
jgi:hypothetical protein